MYELTKNEIPVFLSFTILTVVFIFFLIVAVIKINAGQLKKNRNLFSALLEERERSMYTMSVELHNNVNQILSMVKMAIRMIEKSAIPEQRKYIEESTRMLDTVIGDMSKMSHSLNSDYLKHHGLYDFLLEETKWINISKELKCTFEAEGAYKPLPGDTELILIRIIQEVIQNTLKHAGAKNLKINMRCDKNKLYLSLKDDGKGFDTDHAMGNGMGLQSIYNRSKIINCSVEINAKEGLGTEVRLMMATPRYKDLVPKLENNEY